MDLVPYASRGDLPITLPPSQLVPIGRGEFSAVHISIEMATLDAFTAAIETWFGHREEVIFVNSGSSSKQGIGYIVLEWEECQVDDLFLQILRTTEFITDYSVYVRSEDV